MFYDTYVGKLFTMTKATLQGLGPNYVYDVNSLITSQTAIRYATSTCRTTYMLLNPILSVNYIKCYNKCSNIPVQ